MCVSPGGHQRGAGDVSGAIVFEAPSALILEKLDDLVWLLLETGHDIGSDLGLLALGLVLLRCNLLWAFLCVVLRFIIG
jgi:hypothetical protein